ncbi:hypothetical protein [Kitasatospora sp. NPDC092286]|uniref:hypothetical protein n=1 Tax=Kitasatospora sp. NPDC092286 TaxID=3364087 RepID=UPI00381BAF5C
MDDATVDALGLLSQALETTVRARGSLYSWHQLTGSADKTIGDAVDALRSAGHIEQADLVQREIQGRDVLPALDGAGKWTFEVIEAYDAGYYRHVEAVERRVREALTPDHGHLAEAEMKQQRRTRCLTVTPCCQARSSAG